MNCWADGPMVAFDLETTSPDPFDARIVTATVVKITPGLAVAELGWLADPGVEIPAEATAVHGITTSQARDRGRPAREVVAEVARVLAESWADGLPVIAYNAAYDLIVLACECARHGLPPFAVAGPVVDPLVIDRKVDPYRRGKRTLGLACGHYGVELVDAHTSSADAMAAARLAWKIAHRHPQIAAETLPGLHQRQAGWHAAWAEDFERWLRNAKLRDGASVAEIEQTVIEREWPLRKPVSAGTDAER